MSNLKFVFMSTELLLIFIINASLSLFIKVFFGANVEIVYLDHVKHQNLNSWLFLHKVSKLQGLSGAGHWRKLCFVFSVFLHVSENCRVGAASPPAQFTPKHFFRLIVPSKSVRGVVIVVSVQLTSMRTRCQFSQ